MSMAVDIVPPALIGAYLVLSIVYRWTSRIPLGAAFILLLLSALTFSVDSLCDHLAFSSFYFLVAGAILLVVEHIRERRREE